MLNPVRVSALTPLETMTTTAFARDANRTLELDLKPLLEGALTSKTLERY